MAQSALATPIPDPQRNFNAVPDIDPDQTPEPSPQVVEPQAPEPVSDAEALAAEEARQHGWVSQEEWQADGRPVERWKPASEFLDIRRNIQSVLKDENRELRARLAAMEAWKKQNEQRTVEAQTKLSQSEVLSQMRQAAEEGDWSKHAELTDKLTDLKAAARAANVPQAQPGVDPEVQSAADAFKTASENQPIFRDKQLARAFATQLRAITSIDPNLSAAEALKEAKDLTMRLYPERFRNLNRTRPAMFETNGTSTASTNGKTWADLSPVYRAEGEMGIAKKSYTKEEYLAACADQPDAWRH